MVIVTGFMDCEQDKHKLWLGNFDDTELSDMHKWKNKWIMEDFLSDT